MSQSLKIYDLFAEAVALPPDQWATFLQTNCGDPAMREQLQALLQGHRDAEQEGFMKSSAVKIEMGDGRGEDGGLLGRELGPYRIEEVIGRGGMGDVYRAVRTSDFEQQVAIKVIRDCGHKEDMLRRFKIEMRALASLSKHPNIVSIIDSGATDDGWPYFVMEYVDGGRIDRHCDELRMNVRDRLQLMVPVCEAVAEAHRSGIIHRDLKPSNILVSRADGTVRLVDFGIATAIDRAGSLVADDPPTTPGQRRFTPEYASPEQHRGERETTLSDVYSLGVLLYRLLSGHLPFASDERQRESLRELVCGTSPRSLSNAIDREETNRLDDGTTVIVDVEAVSRDRSTTPDRLRRQLAGELECIAFKALERDPRDRYQAAGELAADIRNHLAGRVVRAANQTALYRARKWVRQHRVGFSFSLGLALVLLVSGVTVIQQRLEAQTERVRAETHLDNLMDKIDQFFVDIAESPQLKAANLESLRRDLLRQAAAAYGELAVDESQSPTVQYRRSRALAQLAKISYQLGDTRAAVEQNDQSLEILRALTDGAPAENKYRIDLARRHSDRGLFLFRLKRVAEAEAAYAEAVRLIELALRAAPDNLDALMLKADVQLNLAASYTESARYEESEKLHEEEINVWRQVVALYPQSADFHRKAARALHNHANVAIGRNQLSEALDRLRTAQDYAHEALRLDPRDADIRLMVGGISNSTGDVLNRLGRPEAVSEYQAAIEVLSEIAAEHPARTDYLQSLAMAYNSAGEFQIDLADNLGRIGDAAADDAFEKAVAFLEAAIEISERLLKSGEDDITSRRSLGLQYANLGAAHGTHQDMAKASEAFARAGEIFQQLTNEFPQDLEIRVAAAGIAGNQARCLLQSRNFAGAVSLYSQSLQDLDALPESAKQHPGIREYQKNAYVGRAQAYGFQDQRGLAVTDWRRAVELALPPEKYFLQAGCADQVLLAEGVDAAIAELQSLNRVPDLPALASFEIGCVYAHAARRAAEPGTGQTQEAISGYRDEAIAWLTRAVAAGFANRARFDDERLDGLRDLQNFAELREQIGTSKGAEIP